MEKPLTLKIEETKQAIVTAINNSNLHPFILDTILKDIYNEIHVLCANQAAQDKKEYEKSQTNEESSN